MLDLKPIDGGLHASGQPDAEDLRQLAARRFRTVIDLRAPDEDRGYDEPAVAAALGLHYVALPVAGPADLVPATVARFAASIAEARARGPALVHCGTANRVGALVALDRAWSHGDSPEAALARGRSAGLAGLEPTVAAMLG
ncbi:protein tyrosine phosphatase family protein [Lysobacter xanthus]